MWIKKGFSKDINNKHFFINIKVTPMNYKKTRDSALFGSISTYPQT